MSKGEERNEKSKIADFNSPLRFTKNSSIISMDLFISSAKVISSDSDYHNRVVNIFIENGIIKEIGENIVRKENIDTFSSLNLHVSVGWLDMRVSGKDPGFESKEDLESLSAAAAAGGFTQIAVLPNTKPTIQTKESVSYYQNFSKNRLVEFHPIGAITKDCEGKDFTEMLDLHNAGAVAFSDGEHPLWNADIFLKTLQYLHPIDALLINRAEENSLAIFGQMHEGITSTMLGMKGIPASAEELMIMRDLKLLEYSNLKSDSAKLHFSCISTAKSVDLIREAKKKGLPISCDIAAHQLAFTDEDLIDFDTNLKVNPPFRTKLDIKALQKGLADGTIDAIVSDHNPHDEESKNLEFDMADFGIIGLQTAFSVANQHSKLTIEQIVEKFSKNPRKLLRLSQPKLEVGQDANLTLFNPSERWVFSDKNNRSKSKNSPFLGKELIGKVLGVINNQLSIIN